MISRFSPAGVVISGMLVVSACTSVSPYQTLPGTGFSTSTLGGAALNQVAGVAVPQRISPLTGSVNRATGAMVLNDGLYLFLDTNGFDGSGQLVDGANTGIRLDSAGTNTFRNSYNYVIPIQYSYSVGGVSSLFTGTVGIETRGADMPTAGTAHYVGEALASYSPTVGGRQSLNNGTSVVDVNFRTGRVDVTMGFVTTASIDSIAGTGMQIVGTSFSGGTWRTYKGGVLKNVTGIGSTTSSIGDFYGYDSNIPGPDEVAGVVLMGGASGAVYGMYLAD